MFLLSPYKAGKFANLKMMHCGTKPFYSFPQCITFCYLSCATPGCYTIHQFANLQFASLPKCVDKLAQIDL